MQEYAMRVRTNLWTELKKIFDDISMGNNRMSIPQVEYVVKNVIGETDQLELDYIFKNLFRLDTENIGAVNFSDFSNFFLKRHCGEIALQRTHKKGLIGKGAERKLNVDEFLALLNDAYSFLKVDVENGMAREVFKVFDSDSDSLITYVEYFTFIDKFICKNQATLKAEAENMPIPDIEIPGYEPPRIVKEYESRLRYFLWGELRGVFDTFDINFDAKLQTEEARNLVRTILKLSTDRDINYVLFNVFKLVEEGEIDFDTFCPSFIQHVCNLGISFFLINYMPGKGFVERDEFTTLFRSSFPFLKVARVKEELMWGFFNQIDTDNDGWISFDEYLQWVKSFLCPVTFETDSFYFELDDMSLPSGNGLITGDIEQPKKEVAKLTKYKFTSVELAKRTRNNLLTLLMRFDKNQNSLFEPREIVDILQTLLKESEVEVDYVIHNVNRYDKDNDKKITYPEMANFLLEMHCGEMAIQRRHLKEAYKHGAKRIMDLDEFRKTLEDALGYLEAKATSEQLTVLFRDVDLDKDGFLTYKEYFEFLTLYFGSESIAAEEEIVPVPTLSPEQEFARWLNNESTKAVQPHKIGDNLKVDEKTLAGLLKKIFKEGDDEIDFALRNLFRLIINPDVYISEDDLRKILVFLHVGVINLLRGHKAKKWPTWNQFKLGREDFISLVLAATDWAEFPTDAVLLGLIFDNLDTNKDGYITYKQYLQFIRSCLLTRSNQELDSYINSLFAKAKQIKAKLKRKMTMEEEKAEEFYTMIWDELRYIYNCYLPMGAIGLGPEEVRRLIIEVLGENSKEEQQYVLWNYFRLDKDGDGLVNFNQFAPYILAHSAEIALQRFHFTQIKGKNTITFDEFMILADKAYGFLKSISKEVDHLKNVYDLLDRTKTGILGYGDYLRWSLKEVAEQER